MSAVLPSWQYICLDMDTASSRLHLYVDDRKLEAVNGDRWSVVPPQNLQLNRIVVNSEKVGLVNLFREPFRAGTCGQNGSLLAWPLMLAGMRPMGSSRVDRAAICGKNSSHLVLVPPRTNFDTAVENCQKMETGGRFPVFSSLEAGDGLRSNLRRTSSQFSLSNPEKLHACCTVHTVKYFSSFLICHTFYFQHRVLKQ
jgi:hypothetical protein